MLGVIRHLSKYRGADRFTGSPCHLEVNSPEIQQVLMNLVSNGLEAMDAGGKLEIKIAEQTDQVTLIVHRRWMRHDPGDDRKHLSAFFHPTPDGQGTGLGLSISHRIIHDHGGTIDVQATARAAAVRFASVCPAGRLGEGEGRLVLGAQR